MGIKFPIYYDAEFTGLHRNTSLVSIGLISYCGAYFYAEFTDYDESQVDDWLREHVIKNLVFKSSGPTSLTRSNPYRVKDEVWKHWNVLMKNDSSHIKQELLVWLHNEAHDIDNGDQVQFYTDCYAYDWMTLMDLVCEDGRALNLSEYINYIPFDLSTLLQSKGFDPDVTREEFAGDKFITTLMEQHPFKEWGDQMKHNSLWDAAVAMECFKKLLEEDMKGKPWLS